jgi:hypothetical protein
MAAKAEQKIQEGSKAKAVENNDAMLSSGGNNVYSNIASNNIYSGIASDNVYSGIASNNVYSNIASNNIYSGDLGLLNLAGEGPERPPGHDFKAALYITNTIVYLDGVRIMGRRNEVTGEMYEAGTVDYKGDITETDRVSMITVEVRFNSKKDQAMVPPHFVYVNGPAAVITTQVTAAAGLIELGDETTADYTFETDGGQTQVFIDHSKEVDDNTNFVEIATTFITKGDRFTKKELENIKATKSQIRADLRAEFGSSAKLKFNFETNSSSATAVQIEGKAETVTATGQFQNRYENAQEYSDNN